MNKLITDFVKTLQQIITEIMSNKTDENQWFQFNKTESTLSYPHVQTSQLEKIIIFTMK